MLRPLVIGNWKMNGTAPSAVSLAQSIVASCGEKHSSVDFVVCPSFVHLSLVQHEISNSRVSLGAQSVVDYDDGAYTGGVSAQMLNDIGCEYVLVGHSERRALFSESNAEIASMVMRCLKQKLIPVLCVGETLQQREENQVVEVITDQLQDLLASAIDSGMLSSLVIAYEPVWAIGTGLQATPEQAQEVHQIIRSLLMANYGDSASKVRILYGGSVTPDNAAGLLSMPDINGALVGGASLRADDFLRIGEQCSQSYC